MTRIRLDSYDTRPRRTIGIAPSKDAIDESAGTASRIEERRSTLWPLSPKEPADHQIDGSLWCGNEPLQRLPPRPQRSHLFPNTALLAIEVSRKHGSTDTWLNVETKPSFVCPNCGSDEIAELSVCVVSHPVKTWSESGEPQQYELAVVDWESDLPYSELFGTKGSPTTFECRGCGAQFETPRHVNAPSDLQHKTAPMSRGRYGCPNCLGEDVAEQCILPTEYTGRFMSNEKGQPEFERDGTEADIFWDCEGPEKLSYRCRDCSHQFREPVAITAAMLKDRRARNRAR